MIRALIRRWLGPDPAVQSLTATVAGLQGQVLQLRAVVMPDQVSYEFTAEFNRMPNVLVFPRVLDSEFTDTLPAAHQAAQPD